MTEGDRTPPQLTKLVMEVKTSDSGARSLSVSFLVNIRDTLLEEFESMAHNAVLLHAHAAGHMPVGPILIRTDIWTPAEQAPLTEGKALLRAMEDAHLEAEGRNGNIVQVLADVELGLSL